MKKDAMKKFAALFVALVLMAGLLPTVLIQADASVATLTDLQNAITGAPTDGTLTTITMTANIDASAAYGELTIGAGQNILLTSAAGSTFTLTQSWVYTWHFTVNGTLTLENINITGGGLGYTSGGIYVTGGTLIINSGTTISGNSSTGGNGGGVDVVASSATPPVPGTFIMNDGLITGNGAFALGGGVYVGGGSTFTMNGGTISNNEATYTSGTPAGGGVYIDSGSTFNMNAGTISSNTADDNGGGVYVNAGSFFTMTGGTITGNTAYSGGGIYADSTSTVTMTAGTISSNNAAIGGAGVYVNNNSAFTMNGGAITGNTVTATGTGTGGGGVYVANAAFTLAGGTISNNTGNDAAFTGGGVMLTNGVFNFSSGTITGNRAPNGGGMYVDATSTLNMTGGTFSNNYATLDGGGIYSGGPQPHNPLQAGVYPGISIAAAAVFTGNTAGNYAQRPPANVTAETQILTTSSSIFNNPVNNFDINFNVPTMVQTLTVTFDPGANGAITSGSASQTVSVLASPRAPASVPTVTPAADYNFMGWSADGGVTVLTAAQVLSTVLMDDTTYVAQYQAPITLTFNSNGGAPAAQTVYPVQVGGTYASPLGSVTNPTLLGYVFLGWFTAATGGAQVLPSSIVTGTADQTLYAQWQQDPTITITFDGNNGSPTTQSVPGRVVGDTYASAFGAVTNPTQLGYTFAGWATAATGGTMVQSTDLITTTSNQTLYAQWTLNAPINLTFDGNGGTFNDSSAMQTGGAYVANTGFTYDGDGAFTNLNTFLPVAQPGYTFNGWFTAATGGTQVTAATLVMATADQTLYAQWTQNPTQAITVTIGGITSTFNPVQGTTLAPVLAALGTPTQAGAVFSGWEDQAGNAVDSGTMVNSDIIGLVPVFTPNPPITITFDPNGGTGGAQTQPGTPGLTYAVPLGAVATPGPPTDENFVGWFDAAMGGNQILAASIVPGGAITLYAQWTSNPTDAIAVTVGGAVSTFNVVEGETFEAILSALGTPTAPVGESFTGWVDQSGNPVTAATTANGTVTSLTPVFTPNPTAYIVVTAPDGTSQTYPIAEGNTYSTVFTALYPLYGVPTRPGYVFNGWFDAATGGNQILPNTPITGTSPTAVYPQWTFVGVSLTFNAGAGAPAAQVVSGLAPGNPATDALDLITTPTLAGQIFDGWFTAPTGGAPFTGASAIPTADTTFFAQWSPVSSFVITFDGQGGAPALQTGTAATNSTYTAAFATIVTPTLTGSVFQGWYTTPNGNNTGTHVLSTTVVTATMAQTLYAHWLSLTVTITFDGAGGTPASQVISGYVPGNTYQAALAAVTAPTRPGYVFDGWADSGNTPVTDATIVPAGNQTLTANWVPEPPLTITFDALGADLPLQTATAFTGDSFAIPFGAITTPARAGFTFAGWFTQITGGTQVTAGDTITQTSDTTLYARWGAQPTATIVITFDGNGGSPAGQVGKANTGSTFAGVFNAITAPTRPGYAFVGWFTAATGGVQVFATDTMTQTADFTLYARWVPLPASTAVSITFNGNGGAPVSQTALVAAGAGFSTAFDLIATPARAGYTFAGWYTAPQGGRQVLAWETVPQTTNVTLYARWAPSWAAAQPGAVPYIPWQPRQVAGITDTGGSGEGIAPPATDQPPAATVPIPPPPAGAANRLVFSAGAGQYVLNGEARTGVGAPFIDPATNRMMIPLRTLAEATGATATWDGINQAAVIEQPDGSVLTLPVGEPLPGGMGMPMMVNDRVYVPLRFAATALGMTVVWDDVNRAGVVSW